jgi:outer membrane immunogenic protein
LLFDKWERVMIRDTIGRFLAAGIAAAAFSAPAIAADLSTQPAAPLYAAAPMFDWSGLYVGLQGGYDWGSIAGSFPGTPNSYNHATSGWSGGVHIGLQHQWNHAVLGVELGASALGTTGSVACPNPTYTCTETANSLLEATAKFGWAWDRTLLYGKIGWGEENVSSTTSPTFAGYNDTHELGGLILGVGAEYAMSPNWTAGLEYLHVDLGGQRFAPTPLVSGVTRDISGSDNVVRVSLNYKFGWGQAH